MSGMFGGAPKPPKIVKQTPVEKVSQKDEEDRIRELYAKRRRANLIAKGIENQPNIYRQNLGTGG